MKFVMAPDALIMVGQENMVWARVTPYFIDRTILECSYEAGQLIEENIYFDEFATKRAIGQKIREFRLSRGVSRLKLGIMIGVSEHQIMKYELGQDNVSASILWKICSVLRCPVDSFFILPEVGPIGGDPLGNDAALLDDQAVLAAFRRITPPEVRLRVARLILTLAGQESDARAEGPEA